MNRMILSAALAALLPAGGDAALSARGPVGAPIDDVKFRDLLGEERPEVTAVAVLPVIMHQPPVVFAPWQRTMEVIDAVARWSGAVIIGPVALYRARLANQAPGVGVVDDVNNAARSVGAAPEQTVMILPTVSRWPLDDGGEPGFNIVSVSVDLRLKDRLLASFSVVRPIATSRRAAAPDPAVSHMLHRVLQASLDFLAARTSLQRRQQPLPFAWVSNPAPLFEFEVQGNMTFREKHIAAGGDEIALYDELLPELPVSSLERLAKHPEGGLLVTAITDRRAAGGLRVGDLVLGIGGEPLIAVDQLHRQLNLERERPSEEVWLDVERKGVGMTKVRLSVDEG